MTHIVFLIALFFTCPYKRQSFHLFSFVILFFFLALRYGYGNDYMNYLNNHTAINSGIEVGYEILYTYLNLLIQDFYLLIAVISLFYILTIYNLIKSNLKIKEYWLAILLLLINPYLFLIQLSSIRQTIAICFFIIAIKFAIKKKFFIYSILIIIAAGFHTSAIVLVPVYFILNDSKIKMKWLFLSFLTMIILLETSLFKEIAYEILAYLPMNYTYYFEQEMGNNLSSTLLSSVYFFLVIFNINKLGCKEIIYGKLSLIATIISILAINVTLITRLGMYFDIFLIITIPQILSKIETKAYRYLLFIIIIVIYLARYIAFFYNPLWEPAYGTYHTILE